MRVNPSIVISALVLAGLLASCCSVDVEVSQTTQAGSQLIQQGITAGGQRRVFPNPLPVTPRAQEGYSSCWAACAEMAMEFLGGGRIRQCEQAIAAFPPSNATGAPGTIPTPNNCCDNDGALLPVTSCDQQGYPEFNKWGFDAWEELTTEIDEGRPFLFSWVEQPPLDEHHMVVAIGYDEVDGDRTVTYIDPSFNPLHPPVIARFSDYADSPGVYEYFLIRPFP